ncbi:MAG: DsbA family protein [Jannaschia sp.]
MTDKPPDWRRRALLAAGAVAIVGWVKGAPHLLSLGKPDLAFEDLPDLAPFRRLANTGPATTGIAMFAGLDPADPVSADEARLLKAVRSDPCTAFFGPARPGPVPVAVFSDFACPICRVMDARILDLQARAPDSFRVIRHQLPLLGDASKIASRAVLAADRQGAYAEMHDRLARTPAITDEPYVAAIADALGLDTEQLLADMGSSEIDLELGRSRAIARVFGFYGTPAFAVGRTVFMGSIPESSLRTLIAEEVGNPCSGQGVDSGTI